MGKKTILVAIIATIPILYNCKKGKLKNNEAGSFTLKFENYFGSSLINLSKSTDTISFNYTNTNNQTFNFTKCGYYISNIQLKEVGGNTYKRKIQYSEDSSTISGIYKIEEGLLTNKSITIDEIPAGEYNKIIFEIGVPKSAISNYKQVGVLSPSNEAWFKNWGEGYFNVTIEGISQSSPQQQNPKYGFNISVPGWEDKDTSVNNVKRIELTFSNTAVYKGINPKAHIIVDFKKLFEAANINFASNYKIETSAASAHIANEFNQMFVLDHVHDH